MTLRDAVTLRVTSLHSVIGAPVAALHFGRKVVLDRVGGFLGRGRPVRQNPAPGPTATSRTSPSKNTLFSSQALVFVENFPPVPSSRITVR